MARFKARKRRRKATAPSRDLLRTRTAEALARGAFQKARELAKDLCKQESSAEHERWFIEATIGRAAQLRTSGHVAAAVAMLRALVDNGLDAPELLVQCAGELMLAADWQTAEKLIRQLPDASLRPRLHVLHADAAILHGEPGLASLPESLRPTAQRVLQALDVLAQGDDAAALDTVAALPDETPWHDWKLLVQGLSAFYAGEPLALPAWQQLAPDRVPAALAAPFRAQLDPDFLANSPPVRQAALATFGQQLYAETWLDALAEVRDLLARHKLPAALRRAGEAMQAIPPAYQEVRDRLARTMYWEVVRQGTDRDVNAYAEIFEAPSDDPLLHRLQALRDEQEGYASEAQTGWASYEQELLSHGIVSAEDAALGRALLWLHMGELAEAGNASQPEDLPFGLPPWLDDADDFPYTASDCYRRSIKLAPQNLRAHERLLNLWQAEGKQRELVRAARELLKHFPQHQRALDVLAKDAYRRQRWDQAVDFIERAVEARPHDAQLASQLEFYQLGLSRLHAQQGRFDEARAILIARLEKATDNDHLLCRLAAVEFKAGARQRGEELFERACQVAPSRLVAVYEMLIQSIRMPLDTKWIRQLERDFRRGLKAEAHAPSALALLSTLRAFKASKIGYEGLPGHEKLILQYLKRVRQAPFSEAQLRDICTYLESFPGNKLLLDFASRGWKEFPHQPVFPFAVAKYHFALGPEKCPLQKVDTALQTALELAQTDPAYAEMTREIEAMRPIVQSAMFMTGMQAIADLFGFDDDDDDIDPDAPWQRPRQRGRRRQPSRKQQEWF